LAVLLHVEEVRMVKAIITMGVRIFIS